MYIYKFYLRSDNGAPLTAFTNKSNILGYVVSGDNSYAYFITKAKVYGNGAKPVTNPEEINMVSFIFSSLYNIPDLGLVWDWFGPEPGAKNSIYR